MPRQVDHEAYRTDLVERCTALFAQNGYNALTMRRVGQHLGVSTGTLYHYFDSKEALFKAVVDDVSKKDLIDVRASIPSGLSATAKARAVLAYVEGMEAYYLQQNLVLIEYFRNLDPNVIQNDPVFRRAAGFYHQAVADVLDVDRERAKAILVYLKGLIFQRLYDGGLTQFADHVKYVEVLVGGED